MNASHQPVKEEDKMCSISEYFESMFKDADQSRHMADVDDPVVKVNYYRLTVTSEDVRKKCDPRLFFTSVLAYTVSRSQSTRNAVMAVEHNCVYAPLCIDCRIQRIDRFFQKVLETIIGLERLNIKEQSQIPECYDDAFKFTFFEKDIPLPKKVVIGMSISEVSGSYELIVRSRFFPEEYIKAFMMIFDGYSRGFASCSTIGELASVEYIRNQIDSMVFKGLGYSFENGCPLIDSQKDLMNGTDINVVSSDNIVFRVDSRYYAPGEKIKDIFLRFIDTHPLFRGRLSKSNGEYRMIFPKYYSIPIWRCDPNEIESTFRRRCDVRNQPLTRIEICDWEGKITIFIEMHMVAFDLQSFGRMMSAVNRIQNGESLPLDDGIIRQAVYESTAEQRPLYMISKSKYGEMLKDAEIDCLKLSGKEKLGMHIVVHPISTSKADIDAYAFDSDLTPNDIFTAAFAMALSKISGKDRCLFYNTVSGRSHIDIGDSIGVFTKSIPFSVSVKDRPMQDILCDVSYLNEQMEQCDIYPPWKFMEENGLRYDIIFSGIIPGLGFYLSPDSNVKPIGTNRRMLVESVNFSIIFDDERYAMVSYTDLGGCDEIIKEVLSKIDDIIKDMVPSDQ